MESPSSDHASGRLYRGEAAYVTDLPTAEGGTDGWLSVDGQITGWINGEIDDEAMFERFPPYRQGTSTAYGLASNDDGFTALGWAGTPPEEVCLPRPTARIGQRRRLRRRLGPDNRERAGRLAHGWPGR